MEPRIFYFCYDHNRPTGGQKHTYQHVDILNRHGIKAYALHTEQGFRLTWFDNDTAVIDGASFQRMHDPSRDYVVLPEDLGPGILRYEGRKVIFNKNVYHGFKALFGTDSDPYSVDDVVAVFSVSEHNGRYLRLAYPGKPVLVLTPDIRLEHFPFTPLRDKSPVIALLPKEPNQIATLYQILRARAQSGVGPAGRFTWRVVNGMTEREVGSLLHEALLFVFLSVEEGLPRMPLEAMAAGCLVVTYAEGPLREHLPERWGFEHGDLPGIVAFIEQVARRYPSGLDELQSVARTCRRTVEAFSAERQERAVIDAWGQVFVGSSLVQGRQ